MYIYQVYSLSSSDFFFSIFIHQQHQTLNTHQSCHHTTQRLKDRRYYKINIITVTFIG
jgi:hypothetical protein